MDDEAQHAFDLVENSKIKGDRDFHVRDETQASPKKKKRQTPASLNKIAKKASISAPAPKSRSNFSIV